jgi:hypothetical protein
MEMILHVQALMSCNSISPFIFITYGLSKIYKGNIKVQSYTEVASKHYLLIMLASKYLQISEYVLKKYHALIAPFGAYNWSWIAGPCLPNRCYVVRVGDDRL